MAGIVQPRQPATNSMQKASHTHPSNGTVIPTAGTHAAASPCRHGMQANVRRRKEHSCRALCKYFCGCVCWRSRKEEGHREAHQHSKRHSWMAAIHAARPQPQQSRTVAAHTHRINKRKKTRRQGVAVCVWRCGCLPALAAKKAKQEGKKCVLRLTGPRRTPTRHGSLSAPFVAAPPHACSRRGAQGRRYERVGGCASGAVGRGTHGTPHRKSAEETIKRGKSRKEKTSIAIAPKAKREGWGSKREKK
ncbi:hypothetical protein ECC02_006901 [Trypanosoma cruzi]|uniref:Uncharacterized protein n=1 Tax=Trypanosoma cruzi TaxID=5693 RepID=A0A7J6Y0W5_TRYCR|nr:hypothetical protein ECC02_006901 [Trypanosoma cruzi]